MNAAGGFNACNYDETATFDDGSCEYPANYPDNSFYCDGSCVQDADGDGVCDFVEVGGCMDEMACNYNPAATDDDGSCDFAVQIAQFVWTARRLRLTPTVTGLEIATRLLAAQTRWRATTT